MQGVWTSVAGPREAHVYLNGRLIADFVSNIDAPINFHVFHADATEALSDAGSTTDSVLSKVAHLAATMVGDLAIVRLLSADERWLEVAALDHPDGSARDEAERIAQAVQPGRQIQLHRRDQRQQPPIRRGQRGRQLHRL